MVPSLALIFIVLGTIFMGLATPTEAGAMGVVGAFVLAWINRRLTWKLVWQAMQTTMRITAMVVFILLGARMFSLVFQGVGGKEWIEGLLIALPGGEIGFLVFVNIFIFIMAFFLDFFEIAFIIMPLLAPAAERSASTSSGSACCSAPTCRRASCIRRSVSRCSICAAWRRPRSGPAISIGAPFRGSSCRSSWWPF